MFDAEVVRAEIRLGFVVSLRPKGAAFGQAGSTRLFVFHPVKDRYVYC